MPTPIPAELIANIEAFIAEKFPGFQVENLPGYESVENPRKKLIKELAALQFNPFQTTEREVRAGTPPHFETLRCTTRLYCLSLLNKAAASLAHSDYTTFMETYAAFTKAQETDPDRSRILNEASFKILAHYIAILNPHQKQALIINTLISSLVLTPEVKEAMKAIQTQQKALLDAADTSELSKARAKHIVAALENPAVHADSICFLKCIGSNPLLMRTIYSWVSEFSEEAIEIACKSFSAGHLRWYLYTEGNSFSVYDDLREAIMSGSFTSDVAHSWFCYWLINIAGFRGHEKTAGWDGARYLHQDTFDTVETLKVHLDCFFRDPNYPILEKWLDTRARLRRIEMADLEQRRFLAHLACLTRTYTAKDAELLQQGFNRLPDELRKSIAATYRATHTLPAAAAAGAGASGGGGAAAAGLFAAAPSIRAVEAPIPVSTYLPQVFTNIEAYIVDKTGNRTQAKIIAVEIGLQLYNAAWQNYLEARRAGTIDPKLPLSFNGLTTAANLDRLLRLETQVNAPTESKSVHINPEHGITISDKGVASLEISEPRLLAAPHV